MDSTHSDILMFHKPRGVVVTRSDELGRRTVYDLLPGWVTSQKWLAVGRLDLDTRGLLLLVRDSSLIEQLSAPGRLSKVYEVWVRGRVTPGHVRQIERGISTPVGVLTCTSLQILKSIGPRTVVRVTLNEGKNRHLRRMFGALKDPMHGTPLKVMDLKRTHYGPLELDVASGKWRFLTAKEAQSL